MADHRRRQDHRRERRDRSGGRERWVCHFPIRAVLPELEEEEAERREDQELEQVPEPEVRP